MPVSKSKRELVYNKFGGRCGYTGKPLGPDWQVDHITPVCYFNWRIVQGDPDSLDNLIPTLRIINHYKRGKKLEEWRTYISSLHTRLKKLPKKTRVARAQKRKDYVLKVAEHFGITEDTPFSGLFYFEKL